MHRIVHHARHHLKRRRNRFLLAIILINILLGVQIWCNFLSLPNTHLGSIPIGMQTEKQIETKLHELSTKKRHFNVNGRMYEYSYEDLGVYLDTKQTIEQVWHPNRQPFPLNIVSFFQSTFFSRSIDPILYFSDNYSTLVDKTIYDFSDGKDVMYLDQSNKAIGYIEQIERYSMDPFALQIILTESLGNPEETIQTPIIPIDNKIKQTVEQTNSKLSGAYENPLTIIIGSGEEHQFFTLTRQALKASTIASISAEKTTVEFTIDTDKLSAYIAPLFTTLGARVTDRAMTTKQIANSVKKVLTKRFDGIHADSVGVSLDGAPNTDGSLAHKYIEVDISQQKLYTFANGALVKTYRVSTGKDYPTPTGSFEILNKSGLGFSTIYNVWMPWWMGFAYSNQLHAYFGIHELPYAETNGNKIQRPRDFIGTPNTGGCVALDVGEAKEVYQFADVGTKVVIYQ